MAASTWKPHTEHGTLSSSDRKELPDWRQLGRKPHTANDAH